MSERRVHFDPTTKLGDLAGAALMLLGVGEAIPTAVPTWELGTSTVGVASCSSSGSATTTARDASLVSICRQARTGSSSRTGDAILFEGMLRAHSGVLVLRHP